MSREDTYNRCIHFPGCLNANNIQIPHEHRIPVGSTMLRETQREYKLNITSVTNSPQKPHFQFEPELDSNTVRMKLCPKKLEQPRNPIVSFLTVLPYLYQLIMYVENNIEGKGKTRQSQYFSFSLLVSIPQVGSIDIMFLY